MTLKKMYSMFLEDWSTNNQEKPSFQTYRRVFKTKNLSFHFPKKNSVLYVQCTKREATT